MDCSLRPVMRFVAVTFLVQASGLCLSQRAEPSRTSTPQPGLLQGLGADFIGVGKRWTEQPGAEAARSAVMGAGAEHLHHGKLAVSGCVLFKRRTID